MELNLHKVLLEEKSILENLAEYYVYDFSEFLEAEFSANGQFGFYSLDPYWSDPVHHHPFFVKVSGKIAGFVLVKIIESNVESNNTIAEFFIAKKYRRRGIGKLTAKKIFDMFTGKWEVTQIEKNLPAHAFWQNVISEYTDGNYDDKFYDGKYHQIFFNAGGIAI